MADYIISMAISIILLLLKNPEDAAKFKAALLKVGRAVNAAFPGEICQ